MTCNTIDPGTHRIADIGKERPGLLASTLRAASDIASVCRNGAALAMMSERELDDLGLLPWEVRSEDWQKESAAATHCLTA